MTNEQVKKMIEYWQKTAKRDYGTMRLLFENKRYPESLFYGHVVLEKILKALVVQNTKENAPYTHDLVRLAELAALSLSKEQKIFLEDVNKFNIRARYPEVKLVFFKKCTPSYTKNYFNRIRVRYKELCQKFNHEK